MDTRLGLSLGLCALVLSSGCASQRDTGEALIASGAIVAVLASEAATGHAACIRDGCAAQTSRHAAQAAAGVAAGVALAAAGAALQSEDASDMGPKAAARAAPPSSWRLVRSATEPGPLPTYYVDE